MTEQNQATEAENSTSAVVLGQGPDGEVYVLATPEGSESEKDPITEPAKVMRIGRMISRMLEEIKEAPMDDGARTRMRDIYAQSITELSGGLEEDLVEELRRFAAPFAEDATPSDSELRVAQAQLVGWLEGLFQGLQTALVAQHLTARINEQQGEHSPGQRVTMGQGAPGMHDHAPSVGTGMYL
jgi:hypothetical protein